MNSVMAGRRKSLPAILEVRLMKLKSILTILLAVTLISTSLCCTTANATVVNYYEDYKYSVQTNIDDAASALSRVMTGDYGMLYNLRNLAKYAMYSGYVAEHSGKNGKYIYYTSEADYYIRYLSLYISAFNDRFGEESEAYHAFKFSKFETETPAKITVEYVNARFLTDDDQSVLGHVRRIYEEIRDTSAELEDVELREKYGILCKNLYNTLSVISDTCQDLINLSSTSFANCGDTLKLEKGIDAIDKIIEEYDKLYSLGEELANAERAGDQISVDETIPDLENLASVKIADNGKIQISEDASLNMNYLAILAAGSTYTPFSSYVGDMGFIKALRYLTTDDSEATKLVDLYNNNKTLKKPLYKRELDITGSPTGVAELITISQFIEDIRSGATGSLCAVKGSFEYDPTSSSWLYRPETKNTSLLDMYTDTMVYTGVELDTNIDSVLQGASSALTPESSDEGDSKDSEGLVDQNVENNESNSSDQEDPESDAVSTTFNIKSLLAEHVIKAKASQVGDDTDNSLGGITGEVTDIGDTDDSNDISDLYETDDATDSTEGLGNTSDDSTVGNGSENGIQGNSTTDQTIVDTSKAIYAYERISAVDRMTGPIMLYGTTYAREIDNMTTMLLSNIFASTSIYANINNPDTEFLYINPFGDIVTQDDLVILPGIANPIMYINGGTYNPFTVAFMNSYPTILNNTSYFQLAAKQDIGKYLVFLQVDKLGESEVELNDDNEPTDVDTNAIGECIKAFNRGDEMDDNAHLASSILTSLCDVKQSAPIKMMNIATRFIANSYDESDVFAVRRLIFGADNDWDSKNPLFSYTPMLIKNNLVINGQTVFPYKVQSDTDSTIACAIADNMFQFLTVDKVTTEVGNNRRLNDNWILHYMLINSSEGTNNSQGYTDSLMFQYSKFTSDAANRAVTKLVDLSKMLIDGTTKVDGVIGLKNAYEDPILGRFLLIIRQYWVFALLMFILILLISFAKFKRDLFQIVVIFISSIAAAIAFVLIIPVYLPMGYNVLLNNLSTAFSYEILAQKAEYYDTSEESAPELDDNGYYKFNSGSLTLYRTSSTELDSMFALTGVDEIDATAGKAHIINQENGIFLQGDAIKVNTDVLFDTLEIDGDISTDASYKLTAKKTVSNNIDYYTPYYQFVDGFIAKLNLLSEVYSIPESTKVYGNGKFKNNYLVYCYMNSQPFLNNGEEYYYELPQDTTGWTDEEVAEYTEQNDGISLKLDELFGENVDWLGISDLLFEDVVQPGSRYQNTLWLDTLIQNEYYTRSSDGTIIPNETMLASLVAYINYQTKKFVLSMNDQIGTMSDDVMVKMVALRALIAFNQKASQYNNWLYPFSINYPEFTLNDILTCMFIKDYDTFVLSGMDIVEYIKNEYGWFYLVIFDILTLFMFLITNVMKILVSGMYVALAVVVLLRMGKTGEIKIPIKGYLKCTGLTMCCSVVLCLSVTLLRRWNYSVIIMYALLLILLLIMYVLTGIISALYSNFMDFGENAVSAKLAGGIGVSSTSRKGLFRHVSITNAGISRRYRMPRTVRHRYGMRQHGSFANYRFNDSYSDYYGMGGLGEYSNYGESFGELYTDEDIENL